MTPTALSLPLQTVYAELLDRCLAADAAREFPPAASFFKRTLKGRDYWYAQGRDSGRRWTKYVGPDNDATQARIKAHGRAKTAERERRELVSTLVRIGGLPAPVRFAGEVLTALADAGVFRLRAVVVGTLAYQAYAPLLGYRLPLTATTTGDLDLAQFEAVSQAIGADEQTAPIIEVLKRVDESFKPVRRMDRKSPAVAYINDSGFRVELIAPNRGPNTDKAAKLSALQANALYLRFLDFLVRDEVPAVSLTGAGVLVNVPAPERYALHKLIVARRRPGVSVKANKDLAQAGTLIEVLAERRAYELRAAWDELWSRGPQWRKLAAEGASLLTEPARTIAFARFSGLANG
jgi:hypothetical protein